MKRTPLRKMSKSKAVEHRKYLKLKREAFSTYKACEFSEWNSPVASCTRPATDIHHCNGRIGKMLNDQKYWIFLCREHHQWVEDNKKEARKRGLIVYK